MCRDRTTPLELVQYHIYIIKYDIEYVSLVFSLAFHVGTFN